jgi:hypothetical protein
MTLNPDDLSVASFTTADPADALSPGGGYCCTGCVSGCGLKPTAGGCASASGQVVCPAEPFAAE